MVGAPTPSTARRIRPLPRPDNFVELAVFRVVQIFFTFCEFVNNIKYNVILFFSFYVIITVLKPGRFLVIKKAFYTRTEAFTRRSSNVLVCSACFERNKEMAEAKGFYKGNAFALCWAGPYSPDPLGLDQARTKKIVWARSQKKKSRNTF